MTNIEIDDEAADVWCFQCGTGYDADVEECIECGVPTTGDRPQGADTVGDEDDDQLAYELHEWTGQGRSILDGMLSRSGVPHAWQGATLIVREDDEEVVDAAISQTEVVAMPTLDLTQPTMVYELADLDPEQHARLLRRLGDSGIGHAFDRAGDLHVYEKDEDRVDEIFEGLDEADSSEREFGPGVPGADPFVIMSDLFVAAGRLRKKPSDAKGVVSFVESASVVGRMTLPYGLTADHWGVVVDRSAELSDMLSGDAGPVDDETIQEHAAEMHDLLRTMV